MRGHNEREFARGTEVSSPAVQFERLKWRKKMRLYSLECLQDFFFIVSWSLPESYFNSNPVMCSQTVIAAQLWRGLPLSPVNVEWFVHFSDFSDSCPKPPWCSNCIENKWKLLSELNFFKFILIPIPGELSTECLPVMLLDDVSEWQHSSSAVLPRKRLFGAEGDWSREARTGIQIQTQGSYSCFTSYWKRRGRGWMDGWWTIINHSLINKDKHTFTKQ